MGVTVRLPNDDRFEIEFAMTLTVKEVCQLIANQQSPHRSNSLNSSRAICLFHGHQITENEILSDHGVSDGSFLELLADFEQNSIVNELSYENFIQLTTPLNGEENISVDKHPTIYFQDSDYGLGLYLPWYLNRDVLRSDASEGDMEQSLGFEEATRRGYIKWTDTIFNHSMFLLEVTDPSLEKNVDSRKYNCFGINGGYDSGDRHSWQRYTNKLPIDCFIHLDEYENKIRLVPELRLTAGATYCLLLQHGVPTPPADHLLSSLFSFTSKGISEDKLIFFRTQKKKPMRASMFG
jgi:uncharacterized ubiquitin-like protein YukD